MELFAEGGDVFWIDAAGKPERGSARFFAEERFGDGLAGAAGNAFDFRVQQDAGFAVPAEGLRRNRNLRGRLRGLRSSRGGHCWSASVDGVVRINAVELYGVEHAFLGELDGGFAFDGIRVGNHANEKRSSSTCYLRSDDTSEFSQRNRARILRW